MRIYYDGTYATAGQLLYACMRTNDRVFVVHRHLFQEDLRFLDTLQDCRGSLGSFVNGRYVKHISFGSPRFCFQPVSDGLEWFFRLVSEEDRMNDDQKMEFIRLCRSCHQCQPCCISRCEQCKAAQKCAEEYGFYDILE